MGALAEFLGHDLAHVATHSNDRSQELSALGFQLGRAANTNGRLPPVDTTRQLLAHGLAGMMQQPSGSGAMSVSSPSDGAERAARQMGGRVAATKPGTATGETVSAQPSRPSAGARQGGLSGVFGPQAGEGRPLPDALRAEMEAAFGADFRAVRVHDDSGADRLSRSLEARAFTYGSDIFFADGSFAPEASNGKALIAHELTHTLQQAQSAPSIARDGERKTTLQCVNENLSSAGVASWLLAIVGTTCGLIGALAGSPTGPGAAGTAAFGAAVCIAGVIGFSVGAVLGIITGCSRDPDFRSAGANPR
ncbi:DUF4157 domain-containing protein [Polymorphobacter fuscus]|uniref:DUF4157 domain-containing protein n=1 Tax=Sandarakinorhabdus fusca TaxID=1439888 RepID=A0A7C9GQ20_9SPHN|nr:DUF4157 domain-containing protein [Polymorphobacter fuscus]KAB7647949.1 DUF4157 domain-containing protein [Polymorphobacter fuscus]MQT17276.1 DUF4157 domain-containing protein [Polymorphobacter fuscus]NJC08728.1 hypothetical protein [Polymorphobacter fuscus]